MDDDYDDLSDSAYFFLEGVNSAILCLYIVKMCYANLFRYIFKERKIIVNNLKEFDSEKKKSAVEICGSFSSKFFFYLKTN